MDLPAAAIEAVPPLAMLGAACGYGRARGEGGMASIEAFSLLGMAILAIGMANSVAAWAVIVALPAGAMKLAGLLAEGVATLRAWMKDSA